MPHGEVQHFIKPDRPIPRTEDHQHCDGRKGDEKI
jgi:hypothetical protein